MFNSLKTLNCLLLSLLSFVRLLSNSTWDYKPPASQDIPEDLRTTFFDSGRNPVKILGSKATGEPCMLMGCSVIFAIRDALNSAKGEVGYDVRKWYKLGE